MELRRERGNETVAIASWQRWGLGVTATVVAGMLLTAAMLKPDPSGLGTHEQLGLLPCSLRLMVGLRCPSCGMTTAWSHVMHGALRSAFAANASGALLALAALVFVPWAIASSIRGQWYLVTPADWVLALAGGAFVCVMLAEWGVRVYQGVGP